MIRRSSGPDRAYRRAVVVDAKDENTVAFYRRYDFIPFADHAKRLFLPMGTIEQLFR
ncbi:MAG: hypothetical protein ACRD1Z_08530 [Vicinamibacteria bacterium]